MSEVEKISTIRKMDIGILGPSGVGKTTLIRFLERGEVIKEEIYTTLGVEYREKGITIGKVKFKIYDVGGQQIYADIFWDLIVQESDLLIYLIDSTVKPETDEELYDIHRNQFDFFCNLLDGTQKVLVLLNKQDLKEAEPFKIDEFKRIFPLYNLKAQKLGIEEVSAKYGENIQRVINWLSEVAD